MCRGRGVLSLSGPNTPKALFGAQVRESEVLGYWAIEVVGAGPTIGIEGPPLGFSAQGQDGVYCRDRVMVGWVRVRGRIRGEVTELGSRSGLRLGLVSG